MPSRTEAFADQLRTAILSDTHRPGHAIPSERVLSEQFALSRTTVRRAIEILVRTGFLTRRPGAGTYVASRAAAESTVATAVACLVPTLSNPLYGEMIDGIEQEARNRDLHLIVAQSGHDVARESECLLRWLHDPHVPGAIVVPAAVDLPLPATLQFLRGGKKLVFMNRWPSGVSVDSVSANHRLGASLAVTHLIGLGHRRIAYVEGLPRLPGFSPYDGYASACADAGIALDSALVHLLDVPSEQAGLAAVRALHSRDIDVSAIFARNDVTASGVVRGLREVGWRIPEDISVASMNNSELAQFMTPPLTSADPFASELGRQAFRLLHDRIIGQYDGPTRRVTIDPRLVLRASVAAAPCGVARHVARA